MKRHLLALFIVAIAVIGCKKDPTSGDVEVTVYYQASTAIGQVPDVGAKVYLFKKEDKEIKYAATIRDGKLEYKGQTGSVAPLYSGVADAKGIALIKGVPFGEYLLVAGSKGRSTYSVKPVTLVAEYSIFNKNFTALSEFKEEGESW